MVSPLGHGHQDITPLPGNQSPSPHQELVQTISHYAGPLTEARKFNTTKSPATLADNIRQLEAFVNELRDMQPSFAKTPDEAAINKLIDTTTQLVNAYKSDANPSEIAEIVKNLDSALASLNR